MQIRSNSPLLGGGDALSWDGLEALLTDPVTVWVEHPVVRFDAERLSAMAARGLAGVLLQAGPDDGAVLAAALAHADALGLDTRLRICAEAERALVLAQTHASRATWLELTEAPTDLAAFDHALALLAHVEFSAHRRQHDGHLPPCLLPHTWRARPDAWRGAFARGGAPNQALSACGQCALNTRCQWRGLLPAGVTPVLPDDERPLPARAGPRPAPIAGPELTCTAAWTTLEIVSPDGDATQCCSDWTHGTRGDPRAQSLSEIWNGEGYRFARRTLSSADTSALCKTICPRLHDRKLSSTRFELFPGTPAFEANQRVVAEDIAERREVMRGRPLSLTLAPSTYCNYDCLMCDHGRTSRRDLPQRVLDEVVDFLPTLRILNLLGGEPLADARVMDLLRRIDRRETPDVGIALTTNGSLLTERTLSHLTHCPFADVTVSVNAATAEIYARVHRGLNFSALLENLDALIDFRARSSRSFGITLSFVVMPQNANDLLAFGELAHARRLPIRLLPVSGGHLGPDIDFYADPDRVTPILSRLDALRDYADRVSPAWRREIDGTRAAIEHEAARRQGAGARRLPVI